MKSVARILPALLLPLMLAGCGGGQTYADALQAQLQEMVGTKYAAYKAANNLPEVAGALVHLLTPEGAWTATAGLPAATDENTHYRIAGVSKTFTAAAVMLLDQQGMLNIDDVVTATIPGTAVPYLPDSPSYNIPFKNQITIRQLLSHRAGVFDVFNNPVPVTSSAPYAGRYYNSYVCSELNEPGHQFTLDELVEVVALNDLSFFAPGANYHYSDTGYSLLAKIIERVSGKSYDRFITENFLSPMKLTQTFMPEGANDTTLPVPFLRGYSSDGSGFFETTEDNMSSRVGTGDIIGTPSDMARWIRTLLSGRGALTPEQIKRMTAIPAGNATYALGISSNVDLGLGHAGTHRGYVNLVVYHPQDDVAIVVVTPFIDYSNLEQHLALLTEIGKEARKIAGYTSAWLPRLPDSPPVTADDDLVRDTAEQIRQYLNLRPAAADTPEGIHLYWVGNSAPFSVTLLALERLEEAGEVEQFRLGNRILYRKASVHN